MYAMLLVVNVYTTVCMLLAPEQLWDSGYHHPVCVTLLCRDWSVVLIE